jgi:hypothetical protein
MFSATDRVGTHAVRAKAAILPSPRDQSTPAGPPSIHQLSEQKENYLFSLLVWHERLVYEEAEAAGGGGATIAGRLGAVGGGLRDWWGGKK